MKRIILSTPLLATLIAISAFACSKEGEAKASQPEASKTEVATETAEKEPALHTQPKTPAATPAADPEADYVRILATHKEPKPTDPVVVSVMEFKVIKANFDPKNLEGASAEIALELPSIDSGIAKRDEHLKSASYFDIDNTPQVIIKVSGVKKAGDSFEASAEVSAHGATKTMPVTFNLLKSDDTSVQIEASKEFDRNDFGISSGDDDSSAATVKIEMRLTLKKS